MERDASERRSANIGLMMLSGARTRNLELEVNKCTFVFTTSWMDIYSFNFPYLTRVIVVTYPRHLSYNVMTPHMDI